ncbi:hypothetical protein [Kaistella rhinocerotis]|uniref:hypothetical protein n=1 Tax=Kaistella rhinocerotis TaxID=3026437 RepID=UPI00255796C7|nr:hypothetical protein [Kaistella sp. Ran72]
MKDSKENTHTPTHISPGRRTGYSLFAAALIIYATYSLYTGKVYIPSRSGEGLSFTGIALKLICSGLFMAAVTALSLVAKSYDTKNKGNFYDRIGYFTKALALVLVAVGTIGSLLYEYLMR